MPQLILASTSPYRRQLLARLRLPFQQLAPACDEEALKRPDLAPQALAEFLARAKAESIAAQQPQAVVIGSDQLVSCADGILGKPGDLPAAAAQLQRLQGRRHSLLTAVCVIANGQCFEHCDHTQLQMRRLDANAIERYLQADQPFDCAGAYKLEAAGISLFERIDSQDHSAITGLPLLAVAEILRRCGFTIP